MQWLLFFVMTGGVSLDLGQYETMNECTEEAQKLSLQPVLEVSLGTTFERATTIGNFHYICIAAPDRFNE